MSCCRGFHYGDEDDPTLRDRWQLLLVNKRLSWMLRTPDWNTSPGAAYRRTLLMPAPA